MYPLAILSSIFCYLFALLMSKWQCSDAYLSPLVLRRVCGEVGCYVAARFALFYIARFHLLFQCELILLHVCLSFHPQLITTLICYTCYSVSNLGVLGVLVILRHVAKASTKPPVRHDRSILFSAVVRRVLDMVIYYGI